MLKFYQKYYVPNNIVISIVGDITSERAIQRIKMAFAGTSAVSLPKQLPIPYEELTESKSEVIEKPVKAAYIMFGFLAPSVTSSDYPAMRVAATALGSGKGSRMFQNLRDKKGLAYELGTIYPTLKNQSHLLAYLVTDPYRKVSADYSIKTAVEDVKKAMLDEVAKLQNEPLSDIELERAKQYTIGTYTLDRQRLRDRAFHLGWLEAVGLGCEYDSRYASNIEAVTAADVQRVAKKYLKNYALTIVLPEPEKDEHK
jgi:zinc protease